MITIRKQNVLIIDDVATSGSTLSEILRTLRTYKRRQQNHCFQPDRAKGLDG